MFNQLIKFYFFHLRRWRQIYVTTDMSRSTKNISGIVRQWMVCFRCLFRWPWLCNQGDISIDGLNTFKTEETHRIDLKSHDIDASKGWFMQWNYAFYKNKDPIGWHKNFSVPKPSRSVRIFLYYIKACEWSLWLFRYASFLYIRIHLRFEYFIRNITKSVIQLKPKQSTRHTNKSSCRERRRKSLNSTAYQYSN